jgi:hypothetical protein
VTLRSWRVSHCAQDWRGRGNLGVPGKVPGGLGTGQVPASLPHLPTPHFRGDLRTRPLGTDSPCPPWVRELETSLCPFTAPLSAITCTNNGPFKARAPASWAVSQGSQ